MEELLNQLNPWWNKENNHKGIIRKKYFKKVLSLLKEDEIIFITGIRRVGKTTLIKQVIHHLITEKKIESNKILFLNLDHIEFLNLSIHDIIKEYRKINQIKYDDFFYLFLDEVTSKENFEQELKNLYDIGNIKIICSSSIASLLNDKKAYLTGRTRTIQVNPLDYQEFLQFKQIEIKNFDKSLNEFYFEEYMKKGGIPKYVLTDDIEYLQELINSILYKDIIAQYNISNEKIVKELFRLLCQRIGQPTSYNKLSNILNVSKDTVKKYISYFEKTFLFYSIEKYARSLNENITSPRKFYIQDLGIKNLVTEFKEKGPNFENLVFLKIKDQNPNYYLKDGIEIDFITKNSLIEVKYNSELNEKQKKVFEKIQRSNKIIVNDYTFF